MFPYPTFGDFPIHKSELACPVALSQQQSWVHEHDYRLNGLQGLAPMKTTHQLAQELLALPNLPVWHFDPSRAGLDDERDTSLSVPTVEVDDSRDGLDDDDVATFEAEGAYMGKFVTVCGDTDKDGEAVNGVAELARLKAIEKEELESRIAIQHHLNRVELPWDKMLPDAQPEAVGVVVDALHQLQRALKIARGQRAPLWPALILFASALVFWATSFYAFGAIK
jgi:hypothetical protein